MKLSRHKDRLFGRAVLIGRTAKRSLSAVMLETILLPNRVPNGMTSSYKCSAQPLRISRFEDRGYIGFFPSGWKFVRIEGYLIDKLQNGGKSFVKSLQDYWFKSVRASSLVRVYSRFRSFSSFSMPCMKT